jgi:hypothetical protein
MKRRVAVAQFGLVLFATALALAVALGTRPYAHPDELFQVEDFRYFEGRAWPPDLGADGPRYSAYGWSRVFALELSYPLLGNAGGLLQRVVPIEPWLLYRLLNVALLPLTLAALLRARDAALPTAALACVLAALPQVLYVFGYANSDAFAVAVSVLLFAHALGLMPPAAAGWSPGEALGLGILTGLTLAVKANFAAAVLLPYALLLPHLKAGLRRRATVAAWLMPILLLPAPLRIVYPLTQKDGYRAGVERMMNERATPDLRPASPGRAGFMLASRGETYAGLLTRSPFLRFTVESFWGVYGHMKVFNPKAFYVLAGLLTLVNLGLTLRSATLRWGDLPAPLKTALVVAPLVVVATTAASLHRSLSYDFQPQGRYLFPCLLPVALLLTGTLRYEGPSERRIRLAALALAFALEAASLLGVALPRLSLN